MPKPKINQQCRNALDVIREQYGDKEIFNCFADIYYKLEKSARNKADKEAYDEIATNILECWNILDAWPEN